MVKKKLQQVISINNFGTNNGIIANNVVVPESSDFPIANNFEIKFISDRAILEKYRTKYIIEAKPKQGVWYQPFFGWPSLEDSIVRGEIIPMLATSYSKMGSGGELTWTNNLDTLRFKISSIHRATTDQNAVYFFCDVLPSTLVFGDLIDKRKVYRVAPSR